MKNKAIVLFLLLPFLAGCSKTSELYGGYAYNSSNFMENYYTETNGIRELKKNSEKIFKPKKDIDYFSTDSLEHVREYDNEKNCPWVSDNRSEEYGRNYNLSKSYGSFAYGYLSKLYDGRVRCEQKYQLSRVQLDKNGYAAYFPKQLVDYSYFGLSFRGASDYQNSGGAKSPLVSGVTIDLHVSFYKSIANSDEYNVMTFDFEDVEMPCDNKGDTNLFVFYLTEEQKIGDKSYLYYKYHLEDTIAMSLTYELKTTRSDLSDDSKDLTKEHHFSMMLYEVLFPNSTWK